MNIHTILGDEDSPVVSVILLTGFLGSGKTTLLNGLLSAPDMAESAVIINEFGDIPIDQHFIDLPADGVAVLPNGCLCCVASDGIEEALVRLTASASANGRPLKRIFIETSGLADPTPVLQLVLDLPTPVGRVALDRIVVTVDAEHIAGQAQEHAECRRQIALADEIVFTKADRLDPATIEVARSLIRSLNAQAIHLAGRLGALGRELPASSSCAGSEHAVPAEDEAEATHRACKHSDHIESFSFTFDEPIEWAPFSRWLRQLRREHGGAILRMKGILNIVGVAERVAVDSVHHVGYPPRRLGAWDGQTRSSSLVFIVKGLSPKQLKQGWDAWQQCLEAA